ncbi:transcriptional regulator GutM [Luteococcus sp. OSA5]|uniref:transcriptional regulator GutM n=1 Tax=Luteococcus sp. OSA5 TaxID=3401630 RepID=UPI003B43BEA6
MFWPIIIGFAVFYIVQTVLSMRQTKDYARHYARMRRQGRVALGKQKNLVANGAIVMFRLDDDGVVVEGRLLSGVTVFSRFRDFTAYNGRPLAGLDGEDCRQLNRSVRIAVNNARDNYLLASEGLVPLEPPGPISKLLSRRSRTQQAFA